jgi:hypothetical protein
MLAKPAFVPRAPLPCGSCARATFPTAPPRCGLQPPARRVAAAAAAVAVSLLGALGGGGIGLRPACAARVRDQPSVSAPAASKKSLRYDGRQELAGVEKVLSLGLTGGAFAALALMAYRKNRVEDELETVRIKEEVERLEKLKAEFELDMDDDEDALDDDEIMAELNKRLAKDADEAAEAAEAAADDADAVADEDDDESASAGDKTADGGSSKSTDADNSASDIDALRRMWAADSPDDEKRK